MRPTTVVEIGSGYSTLFLLRALAENAADVRAERDALVHKTHELLPEVLQGEAKVGTDRFQRWFRAPGRACCLDPAFYIAPRAPHLHVFETLAADHSYCESVRRAVEALDCSGSSTFHYGREFSADAIPEDAGAIDLAWHDGIRYREFFDAAWTRLNPRGGTLVFHNVTAVEEFWAAFTRMKTERAPHGDLESLVVPEPHRGHQSGCGILRRTTEYRPPFHDGTVDRVVRDLRRLLGVDAS